MVTQPENVSQTSSVDGQSPKGLVNTEEAMKSVKSGGNLALLVTAVTGIVTALAVDFDKWYQGPLKDILSLLIGAAVALLGTRLSLRKYANQGPESFLDADHRILFSKDDETDG
jgi:uncharacterized membrane protein YadS